MTEVLSIGMYFLGFIALLAVSYKGLRITVVGDSEVGIVTKKMSGKSLPAGHVIALNGEAGIQAETFIQVGQ